MPRRISRAASGIINGDGRSWFALDVAEFGSLVKKL